MSSIQFFLDFWNLFNFAKPLTLYDDYDEIHSIAAMHFTHYFSTGVWWRGGGGCMNSLYFCYPGFIHIVENLDNKNTAV